MYVIVDIQGQQFNVEQGRRLFIHHVKGAFPPPLVKGDKVLVFHKKRRKGYRKLNGHRQQFSEVLVKEIIA